MSLRSTPTSGSEKRYNSNGISIESSRVHLQMLFLDVSRTSIFLSWTLHCSHQTGIWTFPCWRDVSWWCVFLNCESTYYRSGTFVDRLRWIREHLYSTVNTSRSTPPYPVRCAPRFSCRVSVSPEALTSHVRRDFCVDPSFFGSGLLQSQKGFGELIVSGPFEPNAQAISWIVCPL